MGICIQTIIVRKKHIYTYKWANDEQTIVWIHADRDGKRYDLVPLRHFCHLCLVKKRIGTAVAPNIDVSTYDTCTEEDQGIEESPTYKPRQQLAERSSPANKKVEPPEQPD